MAEDKKSFILYADFIDTFEDLEDDEAGRLIKHILRYVNDRNPVTEEKIVKVAFGPIKRQLKRDLKKYEGSIEVKKENGAMGNLKRWNKDLHEKVMRNEVSLQEALFIAEDRKASRGDKTVSHRVAKIAVTDNVTVTVNDTDNVISLKKESPIETFFTDLPNSTLFEDTCRLIGLTKSQLSEFIPGFRESCELKYTSFTDFANHFKRWVKIERGKPAKKVIVKPPVNNSEW